MDIFLSCLRAVPLSLQINRKVSGFIQSQGRINMIGKRFAAYGVAMLFGLTTAVHAQPPKLPEGVKAQTDLEYVKDGHERQKLDLYLPEKAEGPLPLIVWIHGGGWQGGSKNGCPVLFLTT